MSIEAAARQAREALVWYAYEAMSCDKHTGSGRHEAPAALLATVSVLALDHGRRANDAIAALDAAPKPLDDPRLQGLFSDAISGALAFGAQNTNPPPAGHWLERFWQMGRAERALSEAAPPAAEPPSTPEMAALWQKIGSPLTGDEFQRHVTAILLRFAPPPAAEPVAHMLPSDLALLQTRETHAPAFSVAVGTPDERSVPLYTAPPAAEPVALTDEVLRYAMAAMGTGSPMDAEKFRLFWRYAHEALTAAQAVPQTEPAPDYSDMSREALERHAKRMAQALADDKARAFYRKHALGPLAAPSCLCCGQLPEKVAIQHMELPEVVLCEKCRNATWAAPQTEKDAARYRWLRVAAMGEKHYDFGAFTPEELDVAIDAAMGKQP
jgi:hypothetical protein